MDPDRDHIVTIFPFQMGGAAEKVITNNPHHSPPLKDPFVAKPPFKPGERERTEPPEEKTFGNDLEIRPYLTLRFRHKPKSRHGFVFGTSPDADVILPRHSGISYNHAALSFDDKKRLVFRDLGSLTGTRVTYETDSRHGARRNFNWILCGDEFTNPSKIPIITITFNTNLKFVFRCHLYDWTKVAPFRREARSLEQLAANLALPPPTELPTGAYTPETGPLYLEDRLATGSTGEVWGRYDVSTGHTIAIKRQFPNTRVNFTQYQQELTREASILLEINQRRNHEHIVRFLDFKPGPTPELHMEYVGKGNLAMVDYQTMKQQDWIDILRQCLDALAFLHGIPSPDGPVVHRNLRPDNIMVASTNPMKVKIADFGAARKGSGNLKMVARPWLWCAPEMRPGSAHEFLDMWSLGSIMLELSTKKHYSVADVGETNEERMAWCQMLCAAAKSYLDNTGHPLFSIICKHMLAMDAGQRSTARVCLEHAKKIQLAPRSEPQSSAAQPLAIPAPRPPAQASAATAPPPKPGNNPARPPPTTASLGSSSRPPAQAPTPKPKRASKKPEPSPNAAPGPSRVTPASAPRLTEGNTPPPAPPKPAAGTSSRRPGPSGTPSAPAPLLTQGNTRQSVSPGPATGTPSRPPGPPRVRPSLANLLNPDIAPPQAPPTLATGSPSRPPALAPPPARATSQLPQSSRDPSRSPSSHPAAPIASPMGLHPPRPYRDRDDGPGLGLRTRRTASPEREREEPRAASARGPASSSREPAPGGSSGRISSSSSSNTPQSYRDRSDGPGPGLHTRRTASPERDLHPASSRGAAAASSRPPAPRDSTSPGRGDGASQQQQQQQPPAGNDGHAAAAPGRQPMRPYRDRDDGPVPSLRPRRTASPEPERGAPRRKEQGPKRRDGDGGEGAAAAGLLEMSRRR